MNKSIRIHIRIIVLLLLLAFYAEVYSQISQGGLPASVVHNLAPNGLTDTIFGLSESQLHEKNNLGVYLPGQALQAGFAVNAGLSPANSGQWEIVDGNLHLWRLEVKMPGALGIGLNFDAFELGEGTRLFVYTPDKTVVIGAFDHRNNNDDQVFSTQVIPGESLIIEYQESFYPGKPEAAIYSQLRLESVIYLGFGGGLGIFETEQKNLGESGSCNININCPEGTGWQNQKRGIARMLMRVGSNYFWCTGTLINNTLQDASPLFLSAAHCGSNATARDMLFWQFYFNFERPGCPNTGVPPQHVIVGADLVSLGPLSGGSDFRLLRLRQHPPAYWRPFWNGWDRSNNTSFSGVSIHHPGGDAKKISTYTSQLFTSNPVIGGNAMAPNSAWRVVWSQGVVEGGSSGSPLFTAQGLVTGTLSGGTSSCSNPTGPDFYGKFWYHWDRNGPTNEQRLSPFLDPLNTGLLQFQGFDPYAQAFPPPGHISAVLNIQQDALVQWFKPGSFPNTAGWYTHASSATHISNSTPERAVFFEPPYFGLSYPVTISRLSHRFMEGSIIWSTNQFTYRIYDANGQTLLHESPVLNASKTAWTEYTLPQPLILNNFFYVAVRPGSTNGTPGSAGLRVNFGQGYSVIGTANNWSVPNYFSNQSGSMAYLTQVFVQNSNKTQHQVLSGAHTLPLHTDWAAGFSEAEAETEMINLPPVSGYKLFRNGSLIHTTDALTTTFTDTGLAQGLSYYEVTATYAGGESGPSDRAYILKPPLCAVTIGSFPYIQTFQNNFNSQCWLNYGNNNWQLNPSILVNGTTINPAQGDQFFSMQTAAGSVSEQWLILPEINFSGLSQPALRFRFNGIRSAHGPVLSVWVSKNNESFTRVWTSNAHPIFNTGNANLQWLSTTLNLRQLANENRVRIAFQYEGGGQGFFGIDVIELLSAAAITFNLTLSVNPNFSGMVAGSGSFLAGQSVTVTASPNLAQLFSGWFQGSNLLSTNTTYSFIMPASNYSLTAQFVSDPTPVAKTMETGNEPLIFPNPAKDFIRILMNENLPNVSIRLFNAHGQLIANLEPGPILAGQEQIIHTGWLPQGVYYVQIRSNNMVRNLKVLVVD